MNDRIRNLLLSYDYSKTTDPLQPYTSHVSSLLSRQTPDTSDIVVTSAEQSFALHKFILAARSPYFRKKLENVPETTSWRLPATYPPQAFEIALRYLYLGELPRDVGGGAGTGFTEEQVLEGLDRISTHLEIRSLWNGILEMGDRRLARQNQVEASESGRAQIQSWFQLHVLKHKLIVEADKADDIKWDQRNTIFADVLLRADEEPLADENEDTSGMQTSQANGGGGGIPIGPFLSAEAADSVKNRPMRMATVFPAHRAMLLRSEFFQTMFSSSFAEAQDSPHLHIIPVDCSPAVLEQVLTFMYTERADIPLHMAVDVLFAADMLLIERLKARAAVIISTLGSGKITAENASGTKDGKMITDSDEDEPLDPYAVLRAAWLLRVPRLEEFAARFFAYRLEQYIDQLEFVELVAESALRIQKRQETDSIELIDDIRYYLSERFRLRFEGEGIEEMLTEKDELQLAQEQGQDVKDSGDPMASALQSTVGSNGDAMTQWSDASAAAAVAAGDIRTLDGDVVEDEFDSDAINYRVLLEKIDTLLAKLELDG